MEPWEPPLDRNDVDAILEGLFDANARLVAIMDEVDVIRRLLEDYGGEEEED